MHPIVQKTFGGLSKEYYFRQLFFGIGLAAFVLFMLSQGTKEYTLTQQFGFGIYILVNTLLYPYARFVYESIVDFIMGDNVFFVNAMFMLFAKIMTMTICWAGAIYIAPVGLAYLFYHHSKTANSAE